ncbi:MAG: ABC transporter ATP-binding protein [Candidatus Cloacimonetes bacterium]|nr:ABC transporter ATP-binding protein [Candidatus Cloacimonadota bacterium]MBS3768240.1 ABC transporter ATP-binding protein [Candidatus Cloacimonadota bacterium]
MALFLTESTISYFLTDLLAQKIKMFLLECSDLSFKYESQQNWLFKNISLTLERGEVLLVTGPSGSGKTTFLNILCKIIPDINSGNIVGSIKIKNKDLQNYTMPQLSRELSLLWQDPDKQLIFPTVEMELAFYPENYNVAPEKIKNRINKILHDLKISELQDRDTAFLSFGEKKLVALASLLTYQPDILLMDELTAGLSERKLDLVLKKISGLTEAGTLLVIADNNPILNNLATEKINIENYK